jgi:mycothiol synthase
MKHLTSRSYECGKDLQSILDLTTRVRPPQHRNDYPGRLDIEEAIASAIVRKNTRLWFDDGCPIAWACVDKFNNLLWELDRRYAGQLGSEIVGWGQLCIRRHRSPERTGALDTNCRDDYTERITFLKHHGFRQLEITTVTLIRPLSDIIPEPELPSGFVIRPIAGKQEAVAAMHRAAFGTEYMTTENRHIIMSTSGYDPSLDLVIIAPEGSVAANCICSEIPQEKIGYTDPVSTHPQFQRMGLARAILLRGLQLLKERGMDQVRLGTSGDNTGMQKAAESAGFKVEYKTIWFTKEVN